jgi:hypothetical protein
LQDLAAGNHHIMLRRSEISSSRTNSQARRGSSLLDSFYLRFLYVPDLFAVAGNKGPPVLDAEEIGEHDFEAQYNQRPLPPGGAIFENTLRHDAHAANNQRCLARSNVKFASVSPGV